MINCTSWILTQKTRSSQPITSSYREQDENGVDFSLIRESLKLTPLERLRRAERAWRDAVRLMELGRRNRE